MGKGSLCFSRKAFPGFFRAGDPLGRAQQEELVRGVRASGAGSRLSRPTEGANIIYFGSTGPPKAVKETRDNHPSC